MRISHFHNQKDEFAGSEPHFWPPRLLWSTLNRSGSISAEPTLLSGRGFNIKGLKENQDHPIKASDREVQRNFL